jgi:hypothetical protein
MYPSADQVRSWLRLTGSCPARASATRPGVEDTTEIASSAVSDERKPLRAVVGGSRGVGSAGTKTVAGGLPRRPSGPVPSLADKGGHRASGSHARSHRASLGSDRDDPVARDRRWPTGDRTIREVRLGRRCGGHNRPSDSGRADRPQPVVPELTARRGHRAMGRHMPKRPVPWSSVYGDGPFSADREVWTAQVLPDLGDPARRVSLPEATQNGFASISASLETETGASGRLGRKRSRHAHAACAQPASPVQSISTA